MGRKKRGTTDGACHKELPNRNTSTLYFSSEIDRKTFFNIRDFSSSILQCMTGNVSQNENKLCCQWKTSEGVCRIFLVGVLIVTNSSEAVGWIPIVASKSAFVRPAFTATANPWSSRNYVIIWCDSYAISKKDKLTTKKAEKRQPGRFRVNHCHTCADL